MMILEHGKIGNLTLKNRIVMAPMGIDYVDEDFGFSERSIDYYVARAEGGTGLIMTGATLVTSEFQKPNSMFLLDNEDKIDRIKKLADKIHSFGSKLCIQLSLGAGNIGYVGKNNPPFSIKEIHKQVEAFGRAAALAKRAGVDAIEVHGYGGYLIDQFQTELWNSREDEYGGSFEGRMRISLEIIEAVKKSCGEDYPIIYKFSPTHLIRGGRELEEGIKMAKFLENLGVSALHVDIGCHACWQNAIPTIYQEPALHEKYIQAVKKEVSIPVIGHGKMGYPEVAERIVSKGIADFVALGHYLLADPEWVNKVKENRSEDIVPCIGCNECMFSILSGEPVSCGVNPRCGREGEKLSEAEVKKSVLVVGGGPGGLEAAIVSAKRGHKVTLWEKGEKLGGNLIPASVPKFKDDLKRLIRYYEIQMDKLGVNVVTEKNSTYNEILEENPDVVILGTGSTPLVPRLPGINGSNVHAAIDVLSNNTNLGENVIIAGGGFVGCETAVHLAEQGKKVTIIEMKERILAEPMPFNNLLALSSMVAENGINILTSTKLVEIKDNEVIVEKVDGATESVACDSVIIALGFRSQENIKAELEGKVKDIRVIGDALAPRKVKHAVNEGFEVARGI
ncbi:MULTISPECIES: FAD-dependent oxidoreductase [Clostridium]|jgi:2-enoate reductase|uniref:oxidoreductase n=1 Tax=Clostridium TaxID=1485 RepID=UPI0011570FEC|nr:MULTISPECIES: FAD-dependent oxidoreductase [Clostridium]MBS5306009.1 FAD-dependent oxidoreductase [Clostridium sp.]MDB1934470.1 FAD-dependent oxidoreductase [Clostridium tertium]MDB1937666.1 FAD-dependent oxidoreductase [Clostridium tertium]MDB1969779.1 FAD-dependent oxidoreductase [Clostridium tertium]MDU1278032.1 FAD-dependent oxidoreductase [Clostridium sp.]